MGRALASRRLSFLLAGALAFAPGCRSPLELPRKSATAYEHEAGAAVEERAEVWVSYQLEIEEVDGIRTDYRGAGRGLYYRLTLPAGEHRLKLRLNYRAPLEVVRSESVETSVSLAPGMAYRLFDLNAGRLQGRVLAPWLEPGAPPDEAIRLERPSKPALARIIHQTSSETSRMPADAAIRDREDRRRPLSQGAKRCRCRQSRRCSRGW